jgi:MFS family permease
MATVSKSILREAAFVRLWLGTTASGLATWAFPFVLGLAVLGREMSATALGLVLAARSVGFLVAVPLGGVLADRHSRRCVVLWAGLAATLATPALAAGMGRSIPLMVVAALVIGAGQGACRPAYQAMVCEVVDPDRRKQANAATALAVRVVMLIAPGIVALLALVLDTTALLVGTGLLWLFAALVPPKGRAPVAPPGPRPGIVRSFVEGLQEARRHPWFLAGLAALTVVIATGYSATAVALPVVSRDRYGTEAVLAAGLTAYTVGGLVGAVVVGRWRPRREGWTALAALACYGIAPLALLFPVPAFVVIAAYVLAGIAIELFNVPWFTATQREVAEDKLARVSSVDFLLSYGLAPVGLAVIAPAIATFGTAAVLGVCAAACVLVPVAAMLVPTTRDFRRDTPERETVTS